MIEEVRLMGQMLIDNAEEIVGRVPNMTSFKIQLDFPMGEDRLPVPAATIIREHTPEREQFMNAYFITQEDKK